MSEHKSGLPADFRLPPGYVPADDRRRIARICTVCQTRVFSQPNWECGEHPGKTKVDENRPYFGQSTKEGRADGRP